MDFTGRCMPYSRSGMRAKTVHTPCFHDRFINLGIVIRSVYGYNKSVESALDEADRAAALGCNSKL